MYSRALSGLRGTSVVSSVCSILRPVINPLNMRAHTVLLANRTLLIVVLIIRLAITTLRQVLSAGVARDGVTSSTGDDVALEEDVDGLERYT